ncbi:hypothetical protein COV61_02370 [Candidatus Micrarchaeota archaeon CG11_big_fil_rev_8_21_14_0_20_47_5]|nr:MAG: hypothetical protein AUJ17_01020 [Candidatus Micrarchaeota archaeon CG1_02_47_40]PIN83705.1 MAG: hypothetical protein COV61_02370 [Candidatus Micrarchaeota archaeon CG11_big_fil_rev_8_21_14_0_20_47_5]
MEGFGFFAGHLYKLERMEEWNCNTFTIDGVRMHACKGKSPLTDAKMKIDALKVGKRMKVLDICTGLGYTAIEARKRGAKVISIEKDENVLELMKHNEASEGLFGGEIEIVMGDAFEKVLEFEADSFERIMLDPPTFKFAPLLYSGEFYRRLFRVLKKGGILLHYTGGVGGKYRGKDIQKGVMNRLREAGFMGVCKLSQIACVRAEKI